jgi:hypothetical protein
MTERRKAGKCNRKGEGALERCVSFKHVCYVGRPYRMYCKCGGHSNHIVLIFLDEWNLLGDPLGRDPELIIMNHDENST